VPVTIVDGYVFVDVRVNGEGPFHFLFDSGAGIAVLDPVARKLGLHTREWGAGFGAGEKKVHLLRADIDDVEIGGLQLNDRVAAVVSDDDIRAYFGTYPICGFIGTPLFEGMAVKLDYVHRKLTFMRAGQFSYAGNGEVLQFRKSRIVATIDGLEQSFLIDTGAKPGLTLSALTSSTNDLPTKYGASVQSIMDWGFGGAVRTQLARGHVLELGKTQILDPVLYLSVQKVGSLSATAGGHIGSDLLSRFDVVFDTSRSRMILEKNANFDRPEPYDRLGMFMIQEGDHFAVDDVVAGGPADLAGVKTGDVIVELDGMPTTGLVLPYVRQQLEQRHCGERVKLLLQSAGERHLATVVLRDLI